MQQEPGATPSEVRQVTEALITKVAWYSLLVNAGLVAAKLYLSHVSGSLALEADAIHSFIDVLASVALILGIHLSSRKSRSFPYGLYKVENIVSVIIAFLVFFTAFEIVAEAVSGTGTVLASTGWVILPVAALVSVPYFLGTYEIRVGTACHSPSLIADGKQHRVDVLSTSVVFFALLAQYFGVPFDNVAAVIVACFIAWSGWGILKDSMRTLLDASIDHETRDTIRSVILSDPLVKSIRDLSGRNSGRFIFVEASVVMHETDLENAHLASERIQSKIRELVPNVERVTIHYEPEERSHLRYIVPLSDSSGTISAHFGEASYFAILDVSVSEPVLKRREIVQNPAKEMERQKGIRTAEFLLSFKPDVVFAKKSLAGKSAEYVFESARVEVRITDETGLDQLAAAIVRELAEEHARDVDD
ncbi:MAG: cation diffusion facilitator family transporter [Methanoregulaceae archaeon]|nr:cation diffusion facilitator family transporter [Methanoregulaceae archaeon]